MRMLFIILLLVGSCISYYLFVYTYVYRHSALLRELRKLNKSINFNQIERDKLTFFQMFDTKYKYDHFNAVEWFDTQMNVDDNMLHKVEHFFIPLLENKRLYLNEYQVRLDQMDMYFSDDKTWPWYIISTLAIQFEHQFFDNLLVEPQVDGTITVNYSYRSPAGRNYYENEITIDFQAYLRQVEVQQKQDRQREKYERDIARVNRENQDALVHYQSYTGGFNKNAWVRQQRAKMTPRLRYRILRRDGFVCQICGRGQADGVILHVDHIKPVSKGGKTEPDNLRTLCDQCNLGKGSLYHENGFN